jgi:hypothetical protein
MFYFLMILRRHFGRISHPRHACNMFNVYESGHRKYIPIYIQQDATLHSLFISGNCVTLHLVGYILEYTIYIAHLILFHPIPAKISGGDQHSEALFRLRSSTSCFSSPLCRNILLSTPLSDTLCLCSPLTATAELLSTHFNGV